MVKGYQDRNLWYASLSAYWYASSMKWFVLLTVVLPYQVSLIVPEGTKNASWGTVFALGALWATIGPSLFGALSDLSRRRAPFIGVGAGMTVLALMVLALARSLPQIGLGYLLLQVADDVGTGPYGALIPEHVPKNRRGRASGMMSLLSLLGQLTAAPIAFLFGARPTVAYSFVAVATVVCATIAFRTTSGLEVSPAAAKGSSFREHFLRGWAAPWRSRDFRLVWGARLMFSLGLYLTEPYLRNYLDDVVRAFAFLGIHLEGANRATAVLVLVITTFAAAGSLLGGVRSDRLGPKRIALWGGGTMAAALLPFLAFQRYDLLLLLAAVFGLGYGIYLSADWALASSVMPDAKSLGRDMGIWQMSVSVVQIFAGGAGRLVDWGNGHSLGLGYRLAFGGGALAFVIGLATIRRMEGLSDLAVTPEATLDRPAIPASVGSK